MSQHYFAFFVPNRAQLLTSWLECIPHLKETVKKYYLPGAFLMDANSSAEKLYKDVILITDPLQHLPFKFYPRQPVVKVEPTALPPVMKTHAATGQRSGPITGESAGMKHQLYYRDMLLYKIKILTSLNFDV